MTRWIGSRVEAWPAWASTGISVIRFAACGVRRLTAGRDK
jgi:hypothetical protein